MASFTRKQIEVRITLAAGSFGGKGSEKVINGLPVSCEVSKTGGDEKPSCKISIGGMAYSEMEQLTTLAFRPLQTRKNLVAIFAGDAENGLSQVFAGEITQAAADFNNAPDVTFEIEAVSGYYPALMPAGPQTVAGEVGVADIVSQQAQAMGYEFRNEGVTAKLTNTILNGTPMQKAKAAARQAGANLLVDDNTLILLPPGKERKGTTVLLSDKSGLMGYPSFSNEGITLDAIYNPAFQLNGLIEVKSIVPKASGLWRITKLEHKLSANNPGEDDWTSSIDAVYVSENTASTPQGTV
jgi:hypothetical protein